MKQGQKSHDREAGRLPAAHSAKGRKPGKGTRWVFFHEIMEGARQLAYKKKWIF